MKNKNKEKLLIILNEYKELLNYKALFCNKYFKINSLDIDNIVWELNVEVTLKEKIKKKKESNIISKINNEVEVEEYYRKHLKCNCSDSDAKTIVLKNITLEELRYLYGVLCKTPISKGKRKGEVLDLISNYFLNIERAISMKS